MRKLEHSRQDVHERPVAPLKSYFKRNAQKLLEATRAIGLGLALTVGTAAAVAPILKPSIAMAQDEYREVAGRRLRVIRLERPLSEMVRDTARYSSGETLPGPANNYVYSKDIIIPNEVTFVVGLNPRNDTRFLGVRFSPSREANPSDPNAGYRGINLNDFNSYVRSLAGRDMERVMFVVETGTFQYNGRETNYTNLYMFPLDANNNILSRRGNGEYVVVNVSYYADQVNGAITLVAEPNRRDTIARNP